MKSNKKKWIIIGVLVLIVTNLTSFFIGDRLSVSLSSDKVEISKADYNEIMKFQKLFAVRYDLYKYYNGKIDDKTLVKGAINGMTNSLKDPYTVYMDQSESKQFNTQLQGNDYVGIGIQVSNENNKIVVEGVFANSPAETAGVKAKDVIEKVNGTAVTGNDLNKAVAMMRGKEGTNVTISLSRTGKGNFDVTAKRQKIAYSTVTGEMLDSKTGYITITMFDQNTGDNFNKELASLKKQGMQGLILDIRDNGGGLLDQSVDVASNFIKKGKLVTYIVDKNKDKNSSYSKGGSAIGMPLVVLVNGNTASASEILSGALRDYKAGTLIGEKTFGKGIVQQTFDTGDNTQLKITVAKWYTPLGENIQHKGFSPDIEVKYPQELTNKPYNKSTDPQLNKALEVIHSKEK